MNFAVNGMTLATRIDASENNPDLLCKLKKCASPRFLPADHAQNEKVVDEATIRSGLAVPASSTYENCLAMRIAEDSSCFSDRASALAVKMDSEAVLPKYVLFIP